MTAALLLLVSLASANECDIKWPEQSVSGRFEWPSDNPKCKDAGKRDDTTEKGKAPQLEKPKAGGGSVAGGRSSDEANPDSKPAFDEINRLYAGGDNARAARLAQAAAEKYTSDTKIRDLANLLKRHLTDKDIKKLNSTAPQPDPEMAQAQAQSRAAAAPQAPAAGPRELPVVMPRMGAPTETAREPAFTGVLAKAMERAQARDTAGARELVRARLAEAPGDVQALRLDAFLLAQEGRHEEASAQARKALGAERSDVRSWRLLVRSLTAQGRHEEALAEAGKALELFPNDGELYAARAEVWGALGDMDRRLADLKQAAMLDAQFDALYQQARAEAAQRAVPKTARRARPPSSLLWLGAFGTAMAFFSFVLFRGKEAPLPQGFKVVRKIGQGGMGVVYEAEELALQRRVAVKKLRSEVADDPRERARFLKEARLVAGLKHPNIVEIHSVHENDEGLFLVFELIEGASLAERLAQGPLPREQALSVLRQIAAAVDSAHARGIVHQDLKPANVMLAGGLAKVMDFGIARRVQETMSAMTRGEIFGTPAYMSPEQKAGGEVGPAADVYALALCARELMPDARGEAVARALAEDPARRWPTAGAFVDALA